MTWGVIASTAVSAYMGIRASKAAKKQANKADASQQEEIALQREGLDLETLEAALREHGVADLGEVEMAVLEIDGSISVVPSGGVSHQVKRPMKYLRRQ